LSAAQGTSATRLSKNKQLALLFTCTLSVTIERHVLRIPPRGRRDVRDEQRKEKMKTREEIKEILKRFKPILKERFKVKEIGIFGSCVRGEESEESDVDILVEFSEPIGWEFIDLLKLLEEILGRRVDLVTVRALKPQLKDKILKEVVYA